MRLDQALANLLPEQSRNRLQAWVRAGRVSLDDVAVCIPKHRLKGGERLCVDVDAPEADVAHAAQDIALDVVHEDDAILVLNKPAGLVVHPGSGNWQGTLLNALLHHCEALVQVPRAGIVHRLDKDTSGLLVVAKTLTTQTHLVRQLQARSVHREYLALAHGRLTSGGRVDAPIGRHPTQRTRMAVTSGGGRDAVTHYRVQRVFEDCTLVSCRLETGRTHGAHRAPIGGRSGVWQAPWRQTAAGGVCAASAACDAAGIDSSAVGCADAVAGRCAGRHACTAGCARSG